VVLLFVGACWHGAAAPRVTPAPQVAVSERVPVARCPEQPIPQLASYVGVTVPGTYWLDMVQGSNGWEPATRLAMPHHHATRLELENGEDFARALDGRDRARFTLELLDRSVEQRGATWFVTYRARAVEACAIG
jgi:hypothetical protein